MNKIIAIGILLLSATVFAQKNSPNISYSMPALEVGFKWNTMDISGATSNKQEIGFQLGGSTVLNLTPSIGLKTGLFYSERPFRSETLGIETKGKLTYVEVPVFFMLKFEEYAGIYLGPSLAIKMGDEVNRGSLSEIKSTIIPITIGAQFKFTPSLGINIFFENTSGDLAKGLSNSRAAGVNLMIAFD
ncbi:MAG: outer membrane beta-barrel protein [Bdellovibrio sp.]|nr:outer membrane beta-barrel protein [Bdellovibrio sp.]